MYDPKFTRGFILTLFGMLCTVTVCVVILAVR